MHLIPELHQITPYLAGRWRFLTIKECLAETSQSRDLHNGGTSKAHQLPNAIGYLNSVEPRAVISKYSCSVLELVSITLTPLPPFQSVAEFIRNIPQFDQ
jgi:hypothetical protein